MRRWDGRHGMVPAIEDRLSLPICEPSAVPGRDSAVGWLEP